MARIKIFLPSNTQNEAIRAVRQSLPAAVQNTGLIKYQLQAVGLDNDVIDLTGFTVTGTIKRIKTGAVAAIDGTLALDPDADNIEQGYFTWLCSTADTATVDIDPGYLVQFTFTSGGSSLASLPMRWSVFEKFSV